MCDYAALRQPAIRHTPHWLENYTSDSSLYFRKQAFCLITGILGDDLRQAWLLQKKIHKFREANWIMNKLINYFEAFVLWFWDLRQTYCTHVSITDLGVGGIWPAAWMASKHKSSSICFPVRKNHRLYVLTGWSLCNLHKHNNSPWRRKVKCKIKLVRQSKSLHHNHSDSLLRSVKSLL